MTTQDMIVGAIAREAFEIEKERIAFCARYMNTNGMQVAIIAVVNFHNGQPQDWATYMGATQNAWKQEETIQWTARHGGKLSEEDGRYFFPDIAELFRWRD